MFQFVLITLESIGRYARIQKDSFQDIDCSDLTLVSAAVSPTQILFVSENGELYHTKSQNQPQKIELGDTLRTVVSAEGSFFAISADGRRVYEVDDQQHLTDISSQIGLEYGEIISIAAGGPGGVALVTNKRGIQFDKPDKPRALNFNLGGFSPLDVDELSMQGVPIMKLKNNSIVTFGYHLQSHACIQQSVFGFNLVQLPNDCSSPQFFPYAELINSEVVSGFFCTGKYYKCAGQQATMSYVQVNYTSMYAFRGLTFQADGKNIQLNVSQQDLSIATPSAYSHVVYDSCGRPECILLAPAGLNQKREMLHKYQKTTNSALIAFRQYEGNNVFVPIRNISDYKSVASSGEHQVFIKTNNETYVQDSTGVNVRLTSVPSAHCVAYSDGNFFIMLADQQHVCELSLDTGTCTNVARFSLHSNEMIVNVAGGPGGLVILTSLRGIFLATGSSDTKYIPLDSAGISYESVARIEVNRIPIFYLENNTVVTYGTFSQTPYGCVTNIGGEIYKVIEDATRFIPYSGTESENIVSMYLDTNHKIKECVGTGEKQTSGRIDQGGKYFSDFYVAGSTYLLIERNSEQSATTLINITQPDASSVSISGDTHRLVAGSYDPQSWLLAPTPINQNMLLQKSGITLVSKVIRFQPKNGTASAYFSPMPLPPAPFTFVASDGYSSLFVGENGSLYYSESVDRNPTKINGQQRKYQGCYYSLGSYYLVTDGGKEIYEFSSGKEKAKVEINLIEGETIVEITYDYTGLLVLTNLHLFLLHELESQVVREDINLIGSGISLEEVQRIELAYVPIIYLRNGTVLIHSTTQYCGTTAVSNTLFYQLALEKVLDYQPNIGLVGGEVESVVIASDGTVKVCKGDDTEFINFSSSAFKQTSIYGNNNNNLSFSKVNNRVHMNLSSSPEDRVQLNTVTGKDDYRIISGTTDPRGWFLLHSEFNRPFPHIPQQLKTQFIGISQEVQDYPSYYSLPVNYAGQRVLQQVVYSKAIVSLSENGDVYYQSSISDSPQTVHTQSNIRQIFTIGGQFFALQSEQTILLLTASSELEEISLTGLGLKADDYIIQIDSASEGSIILTNSSIIQFEYKSSQMSQSRSWNLGPANITPGQISRVEYRNIPVVYLHNRSVFVLDDSCKYVCTSTGESFQKVGDNIDKFIPYSATAQGSAGTSITSYYLAGNKVYKYCQDTGTGSPYGRPLTGSYEDFDVYDGHIITSNSSYVQNHSTSVVALTNRTYRIFRSGNSVDDLVLWAKKYDGHFIKGCKLGSQSLLVASNFARDAQIVNVCAPPLKSACSNGETTFYISTDNQLYEQLNKYVQPTFVTQVTNVTQCAFMDQFWFVTADGSLFTYDYQSYKQETIAGEKNVKYIGSNGIQTLQIVTDDTIYQITSEELVQCKQNPEKFKIKSLEPPFKAGDIVAFDAEPLGFTYYMRNGDAYTTNENSQQLCGQAQSSYFKKLGISKIRRYSICAGTSYIMDKKGILHNCTNAQDVNTQNTSISDIADEGVLTATGTLHVYEPENQYVDYGQIKNGYILFAGAFRVVVSREIRYKKASLGLILGLALGVPVGVAFIVLLVLLVLKNKGYFIRRTSQTVNMSTASQNGRLAGRQFDESSVRQTFIY